MSEYRRQIAIGGTIALIVGIIVIASVTYLPLVSPTTNSSTTISSSTSSNQTFTTFSSSSSSSSSTSASGPQLQINLNATQIVQGSHLGVNIQLYNPLSTSVSLNVSYSNDKTILAWNGRDFLCNQSPVYDLFGFALYQGHYTSQNISTTSSPLLLAPEAAIGCPTSYQPNISKITLAPKSDSANMSDTYVNGTNLSINASTQACQQAQGGPVTVVDSLNRTTTYTTEEPGSYECGPGSSLYGYWTDAPVNGTCTQPPLGNETAPNSLLGPYCNLVSFPVGSYTLVAQDLWNQTVYAYFQVGPNLTIPTACPVQNSGGFIPFDVPKISSFQNSTFTICARLYYYNSTAIEIFNTSSVLGVGVGGTTINETLVNHTKADFSVSASPSKLTLGGLSNINEGTMVEFTISTGDTSNGTFVVYFNAPLHPSFEICNEFTQLIVSNANPFYAYNPSCTAPLSSNHHTNSQGFVDGYLTAEVVGMSNSTS